MDRRFKYNPSSKWRNLPLHERLFRGPVEADRYHGGVCQGPVEKMDSVDTELNVSESVLHPKRTKRKVPKEIF